MVKSHPDISGKNNPFYGKHHKPETFKNHFSRGKTYEEIYGTEKAERLKSNHSHDIKEIIKDRGKEWLSHFGNFESRPTRPEKLFKNLIKEVCFPLKYTGDGSYWIGCMNPDFIEINGMKVCIEIFGDYWHNENINKSIHSSARYKNRLKMYDKEGWKCLIIWEKELKNKDKVIDRVRRFLG